MQLYPKGSEWRKWDLHFHTGASHDCKYKASEKEILDCLLQNEISVVAITDHHVINVEFYKNLSQLATPHNITVLPGIEFLCDSRGKDPIHFIGIFSESSNIDFIWAQLQNCTNIKKVAQTGEKIDAIYCNLIDTVTLIHELGGIATIHAGEKSNSIENITHALSHTAAQKKEIADIIDIFEVGKVADILSYQQIVFPHIGMSKPLIICSDNHDIRNYATKKNLWIKADPNFHGLKQTIIEPGRVFVGNIPPAFETIATSKTKRLKSLDITWNDGYSGSVGHWFKDIKIELNPEMIAIIGNKGSGKTAISEIIALLSNSKNEKDFVFLNKEKFRKKKLASNFKAKLCWHSDSMTIEKNLQEETQDTSFELVHFIPQRSFESICNGSDKDFESELNNVVFSRVPEHDKLGCATFDELIQKQRDPIYTRRHEIKLQISKLNNNISELEKGFDKKVLDLLQNELLQTKTELYEHSKTKPKKVIVPEELEGELYRDLNKCLQEVNEATNVQYKSLKAVTLELSTIDEIKAKFENLESYISDIRQDIQKNLEKLDLNFNDLFEYTVNYEKIKEIGEQFQSQITKTLALISNDTNQIGEYTSFKNEIQQLLNIQVETNKGLLTEYQNYCVNLESWRSKRDAIKRAIRAILYKIKYIGAPESSPLANDIEKLRLERLEKTLELFQLYDEEVKIYNLIKEPIELFITEHKDKIPNNKFSIEATVNINDDFKMNFINKYINLAVSSEFKGEQGVINFNELINKSPFETEESIKDFLMSIQHLFETPSKYYIHNLFKKDKYISAMNMIYNLDFLDIRYSLKMDNKFLYELSPGEKGSLLLLFYLFLDNRDIPLIIDQPEDNLDNESVAKILLPFIKEVKKRRQLIIITHNPNLAVVSDAEQIIRVSIDKQNDNKFSYKSGSLESKIIDDVVKVLEGTKWSFDTRSTKYNMI